MSAMCSAIALAEESLYDPPKPLMRPALLPPKVPPQASTNLNVVQDRLQSALAQYAILGALTRELRREMEAIIEQADNQFGMGPFSKVHELRKRRQQLSQEIRNHFTVERRNRCEILNREMKNLVFSLPPVVKLKVKMCLELLSVVSNRTERADLVNEIRAVDPLIAQLACELDQHVYPTLQMCNEYQKINDQLEQGRIFLSRCHLLYAEMLVAEAERAAQQRDSIMSGLYKHAARGILNEATMRNAGLLKDEKFLELAWKSGLGKNQK